MKNKLEIIGLLKQTVTQWQEDKASRLAAALAYYTAFSIAPLLIIVIAIVGLVFGEEAAKGEIVAQLQGLLGIQGAEAVQTMIENSRKPSEGIIASIISFMLLIFGATGVFAQLQDALNTIWEVAPKPGGGVKRIVKDRFPAFTMIIGIGFLLLVSLVLSAGLDAVVYYLGYLVPSLKIVWSIVNFIFSFLVTTVLFAMIYKILPDVEIGWGDVWIGSIMTSFLFTIGKSLIGLYLGNSGVSSTYGAAGSFVVLLLWVNFSSQILFFGAEFTKAYADKYGSKIVPTKNAVPLTPEARAQQGIPRSEDLDKLTQEQKQITNKQIKTTSDVDKPLLETTSDITKAPHPAAIALSLLIGAYQQTTKIFLGNQTRSKKK